VSKLQKAIIARVLLLAAFWLSGCSFFSSPIDISGLWVGTIQWTDGPAAQLVSPITLDLVHEGRDLSGTVTLTGPASTSFDLDITDGRARTFSMSLEATGTLPINPPLDVTIKLDGDFLQTQIGMEMSGTGTQTVNGTTYRFTFEAVLVAPAIPEE
jgi:hypothetical protein